MKQYAYITVMRERPGFAKSEQIERVVGTPAAIGIKVGDLLANQDEGVVPITSIKLNLYPEPEAL